MWICSGSAERVPGQRALDRSGQILCGGVLQYEGGGTRAERDTRDVLIAASGHQHHFDLRQRVLDGAAGIEPVHPWHGQISDDDVGLERGRGFKERAAVANRPDDIVARLEQTSPGFEQPIVVIRQQNPRSHGAIIADRLQSRLAPCTAAGGASSAGGGRRFIRLSV